MFTVTHGTMDVLSIYFASISIYMYTQIVFGASVINENDTVTVPFNATDLENLVGIHHLLCTDMHLCSTSRVNKSKYASLIPVDVPEYLDGSCCKKCSCDQDNCLLDGTCCPDVFDYVPTVRESFSRIKSTCEYANWMGVSTKRPRPRGFPMFMTRKCPDSFMDTGDLNRTETIHRCENPQRYNTLDDIIPVTDLTTSRTYQNIHCSRCFGVPDSQITYWNAYAACKDTGDERQLYNMDNNIVDVVNKSTSCNILYKEPVQMTGAPPYCPYVVKECNVTGIWKMFDPLIEAACHAYASIYYQKYQNIFCALCNEPTSKIQGICTDSFGFDIPPSFAVLLDFKHNINSKDSSEEHAYKTCTASQVLDTSTNVCRNLFCRFPRTLVDKKCVNKVTTVTGGSYTIYLKLQPEKPVSLEHIDESANVMEEHLHTLLEEWGISHLVYAFDMFYKEQYVNNDDQGLDNEDFRAEYIHLPPWCKPNFPPPSLPTRSSPLELPPDITPPQPPPTRSSHSILPTGITPPPPSPTRPSPLELPPDITPPPPPPPSTRSSHSVLPTGITPTHTETNPNSSNETQFVIPYFLFHITFYLVPIIGEINVTLFDEILSLNDENAYFTGNDSAFSAWITYGLEDFDLDGTRTRFCLIDKDDNKALMFIETEYDLLQFEFNESVLKAEVIAEKTLCPLLSTKQEQLKVERVWEGLYVSEINATLPMKYVYEIEETGGESHFYICADIYLQRTEHYAGNNETSTDKTRSLPQRILSIVCTCLSVVCAVLTLVTYALFKELRTQPGINNTCLIICLIVAQLLFQFGLAIPEDVGDNVCILIGVLVHSSWLMVVMWMTVCSYHMFKVFIHTLEVRKHSAKFSKTLVYVLICSVLSGLLVATNILVSFYTSNRHDYGYSTETCYISQPHMVGYVFALPVGILILINIALFVIVIVKVSRYPTVHSDAKIGRNYVKIYAKLSTLTGVTWIFGFLFTFTEVVVFEYLFVIINASQGVFIFIAFVLNKRVIRLYKDKFSRRTPSRIYQTNKSQPTSEITISSKKNAPK